MDIKAAIQTNRHMSDREANQALEYLRHDMRRAVELGDHNLALKIFQEDTGLPAAQIVHLYPL